MSLWREFRATLAPLSPEEKLSKISKFFAYTPIGTRTLDYYSPSSWPIPWEILYHGSYCTNSISLLIYYTLRFFDDFDKVVLWLINDGENTYLVPVIDGKHVMNYELGEAASYQSIHEKISVLEMFDETQVKQLT